MIAMRLRLNVAGYGLVLLLGLSAAMCSTVEAAAGRTPGAFDVSATGAATYAIPLWVPPGPHGVQPNLALSYSSRGGDTTLGIGWSLAGLSAIERCALTRAQDGVAQEVKLTMSDRFCLDGNRLRVQSGAVYGGTGSTYYTEMADFSTITAYGAAGNGPGYFIVKGKNGLTYEYGNSATSRVTQYLVATPYKWLLNKVSDGSGNSYEVTYGPGSASSLGTAVPLSIAYTRSSSGSATYNYTVDFTYTTREAQNPNTTVKVISEYIVGNRAYSAELLQEVNVRSGGALVRKYTLGYGTGVSSRARLTSVTECGGTAGIDCLAPTSISYYGEAVGVSNTAGTVYIGGLASVLATRDFNGDGRDDILYRDNGTYQLYVVFSTPAGAGSPVAVGTATYGGYAIPSGPWTIMVGDMTGSGKNDILLLQSGYWWRYWWNGSSFSDASTGIPPSAGVNYGGLADLNGDGLPDLITAKNASSGSTIEVYTRLNTTAAGSGVLSFAATQTTARPSTFYSNCIYSCKQRIAANSGTLFDSYVLDFNGDGDQDLALAGDYWTLDWPDYLTPPREVFLGGNVEILLSDGTGGISATTSLAYSMTYGGSSLSVTSVNHDRCTDINSNGRMYASLCNGNFSDVGTALFSYANQKIDWNGDGLEDVIGSNESGNYIIAVSTAEGPPTSIATSIPITSIIFVFDQDGDAQADLGAVSNDGLISYYLHNSVGSPPDTVASIVDGYGLTYGISFVSTANTNSGVYSAGTAVTFPERPFTEPLFVVSQVTLTDGTGSSFTKSYTYSGAIGRHDSGEWLADYSDALEFEGFQSRTVSDSRAGAPLVKTYYKTAVPYTGMVYQQDVFQNNSTTLISHTINTPDVMNLDTTSTNQRYFPYLSAMTTDTYEVGGSKNGALITQSSASFSYDNYGNATASTVTVTDKDGTAPQSPTYAQSWTTTVTQTINADAGNNWCLGLPTRTTVSRTASNGEQAVSRITDYAVDYAHCRVTQQVIAPGTAYQVTTDYGYDAFGNVSSQTVTGAGMAARTTGSNWGTTGQFPLSVTNALNQTTQAGYDYGRGVQTSLTDPNNVTVGWGYDNFGRKESETRADGTSTLWTYNLCSQTPGMCPSPTDLRYWVRRVDRADNLNVRESRTFFDGLDRLRFDQQQLLDGSFTYTTHRGYDALGRTVLEYVPSASENAAYHRFTYDGLNRPLLDELIVNGVVDRQTAVAYAGRATTVTDALGKQTLRMTDPNGWLRHSQDHSGYYQRFTYDALGSLKGVVDSQFNTLFSATYVYGLQAFQTATHDMDLGDWGYTPNALGEVVAYTDNKGVSFSATYDPLSRPLSRTEPDTATGSNIVTNWTWGDSSAAHNIGQVYALTSTGGTTETYDYDSVGRLAQRTIVADGTPYTYTYDYNTQGQLDTLTYPTSTSGYRLRLQHLYQYGWLQQVRDYNAGTIFWQANTLNPRGQVTQETLGNGLVSNHNYDAATGWLNYIQCGSAAVGGPACAQNQSYLFDKVGNLVQRQNANLGLTENFFYDDLHRLDYSQLNGVQNLDLSYDALGNITRRSDVANNATWTYDPTHKHQVLTAGTAAYSYDGNGNVTSRNGSSILWTSYNYPSQINGPGETVSLFYDANRQRYKQVYAGNGFNETTLYLGGLLQKVSANGVDDYRYQIQAQGQTVAIMSRLSTGTNATRYMLTDYQGSVTKLTDSSGTSLVSESFTAYGARRNPATWSGNPTYGDQTTLSGLTRDGYTGATALGSLGLTHLNGRVQDAITGRFLSADPYITEPGNTQNYNRYSYVYNNPMSYTDPSGFFTCNTFYVIEWVTESIPNYVDGGVTNIAHPISVPQYSCHDDPGDYSTAPPDIPGLSDGNGNGADASKTQKPKQCLFSKGAINTISSAAGGAVTGGSAAALTGNWEAVPPAAFGGAIVGGASGALENNIATAAAGTGVAIGAYATGRASGVAAIVTAITGAAQTYAPQGTSILAAALGGAARGASSPGAYGALIPRGLAAASGLGRFGTAAALGLVARQATRTFLQQVNNYLAPGCSP